MDRIVIAAQRYIQDQEDSAYAACVAAAADAGFDPASALECDNGDRCCPMCPWRRSSENE